jgi:lysophospholipase L1-like esterase
MKSLNPFISLFFIVAVGSLYCLLSLVWPTDGIGYGEWKVKFFSLSRQIDSTQIKLDMQSHLARLDSIATADSLRLLQDTVHVERSNSITSIQFFEGKSDSFHSFFEALDSAQFRNVDVFHYGDSQIECDRMTQILRTQLQKQFGGYGPGLIAPVPLVATSHIVQNQSANWKRSTAYGYQDHKVNHNQYGVMCSFGKFDCSEKNDSTEATIELMPTRFGEERNKTYHVMRMYYRAPEGAFGLQVLADEKIVWTGIADQSSVVQFKEIAFDESPKKIRLVYKAKQSPEIHAIQLEENTGITVSNIALRGSDGFLFTRTDVSAMGQALQKENTQLILLQFGGNSIPYLKSNAHAQACAEQMAMQVKALRKQAPKAAFLIVGPSDMSTSIDGVFQTYPYLAAYNDALKQMAFTNDCAFWDMYAVMGGKNSMVAWVANSPPYAGPDYTHFTPLGARKMGDLMAKALLEEYRLWKTAKTTPTDLSQ